ncbi:MAG: AmmeMemoRadiSam system protein B [Candidatus Magasanikbacteria bacterium]|nr:AmmeMemoRadiSam system protein B [Candidatus Magasanikbacteria bacterium]
MSLVFAAITPHPPLLIPSIGKDELRKVAKTKQAMDDLEEQLYAAHPDAIVIISPHGSFFPDVFTINYCTEYYSDLKQFGDLSTKLKFSGDFELAHRLRDATKREHLPATMISEEKLDHGAIVPLYYLTRHLPNCKIIQLGFCNLDYKTHLEFGALLKEEIFKLNKRIAVVASGDMSHALSNDAPAGFNKHGQEFDAKMRELLMAKNLAGILKMDAGFVEQAAECGLRSILILLGMLQNIRYDYRELSYEGPFGVGYLTSQFIF